MTSTLYQRRRALIDALRSGNYQQCVGYLCKDGKYCCLGVACEVATALGLQLVRCDHPFVTWDGHSRHLPQAAVDFYGFHTSTGYFTESTLVGCNDLKESFAQIATRMETDIRIWKCCTPAEARALWVTALRSGKYQQGQGALLRNGKYCCLGVACEVAIAHGVPISRVLRGGDTLFGGAGEQLPGIVRDWLGLVNMNGVYVEDDFSPRALYADNDHCWKSFAQIADIIESNPRGLCNPKQS